MRFFSKIFKRRSVKLSSVPAHEGKLLIAYVLCSGENLRELKDCRLFPLGCTTHTFFTNGFHVQSPRVTQVVTCLTAGLSRQRLCSTTCFSLHPSWRLMQILHLTNLTAHMWLSSVMLALSPSAVDRLRSTLMDLQ
jgi:hypothetical protein